LDAQRNRRRILEAARQALIADPEASLNSVAKLAGIGPGTLYRHFPTRADLIMTLYQTEVEALSAEVSAILADNEPLDAFRIWFKRLATYVRVKHGLGDALNTAAAQRIVNATYAPVTAAVSQLLEACVAAGVAHRGLDASDVLLLMGFLWRVAPSQEGLAQADRITEMVINALRR
jgi:AcrR family transcriptional regulator